MIDTPNTQPWMNNPGRLCAKGDPENWHPHGGTRIEDRAKELCKGCPVINACLQWALTDKHDIYGYPGGICGGTTEDERRKLRGEPPRPAQTPYIVRDTCGTLAGHNAHKRAGEGCCDDCRGAWNAYRRQWRRKNQAAVA